MTAEDAATSEIDPEVSGTTPPPPPPPDPTGGPTGGRDASNLVGAGILLSRLAGFAREAAIAGFLGAGVQVDAFKAALRIPNVLQNLLGEGVLSASFIPVYARLLAEGEEEEAGRVAGAIAGLLAALAGVLVVIGVVFARPLTAVLAGGFPAETFELTVTLTRILTPGIGVLVLSAWCLGVLNSHRHFFLSYVAPVLWNVAQIAVLAGLWLVGVEGNDLAVGLAWGAVIGGFLQLGVQLPSVRRLASHLRLSLRTDLAGVRTAIRRFVPVVAGRGVVQLSGWIDLLLASFLVSGAVSGLAFAQIFYLLPISLFGMSVAAAELPELSRLGPPAADDVATWRRRIDGGLQRVAFFVAGTSVAYLVVGDLIVATVLERGRFGAVDTRLVWIVLAAFTLGLLATTSARVLQSSVYALGDTRTPAKIAAVRVCVALLIGAGLMFPLDRVVLVGTGPGDVTTFADGDVVGEEVAGEGSIGDLAAVGPLPEEVRDRRDGVRHLGAVGLALGSGIAAWVELHLLRRRLAGVIGRPKVGGGHFRAIAGAGLVAAAVGVALRTQLGLVPEFFGRHLVGLLLVGGPTGVAYLVAASVLGVPEARTLTRLLRRLPGVPGRR
jgi:putative peptidoglycan lipid II flippase